MRFSGKLFAAFVALTALLVAACASTPDPTATTRPNPTATPRPSATAVPPTATVEPSMPAMPEPVAFSLVSGWYQDGGVEYYDFGMNTPLTNGQPLTAPIYVFIHGMNADGTPDFVEGQHNIVDVVPGDEGYSDLWEVILVTVPDGYEPDSIRSMDELMAAGYDMMAAGILVNCPIVPEGSTFEGDEQLTQGWYKGEDVYYPDFGMNPATAIPIWAFITGMDADGNPQFVEGQRNVIDSVPGDVGYSAFWRVNLVVVPAGYEANSIRSAHDVMNSGYEIIETDLMVNCPVTEVEEAMASMPGPTAFSLVSGWYQDRGVEYYDFGMNTPLTNGQPLTAPIYAFIYGMNADGTPDFVAGQHNIVDVVPGDEGYSDLWEVILVTVPQDYQPDSIRSMDELMAAGYDMMAAGILVNCPIVPEGSTFEGDEELTQGWYKGEEVYYPDFGMNPVTAIPIWAFITGMDADGNPQFVEGQRNVIDSVPGDAGYSAFWRVNLVVVPEGYEANSIRSAHDVMDSGYEIIETDLMVNCPVTEVEAA